MNNQSFWDKVYTRMCDLYGEEIDIGVLNRYYSKKRKEKSFRLTGLSGTLRKLGALDRRVANKTSRSESEVAGDRTCATLSSRIGENGK